MQPLVAASQQLARAEDLIPASARNLDHCQRAKPANIPTLNVLEYALNLRRVQDSQANLVSDGVEYVHAKHSSSKESIARSYESTEHTSRQVLVSKLSGCNRVAAPKSYLLKDLIDMVHVRLINSTSLGTHQHLASCIPRSANYSISCFVRSPEPNRHLLQLGDVKHGLHETNIRILIRWRGENLINALIPHPTSFRLVPSLCHPLEFPNFLLVLHEHSFHEQRMLSSHLILQPHVNYFLWVSSREERTHDPFRLQVMVNVVLVQSLIVVPFAAGFVKLFSLLLSIDLVVAKLLHFQDHALKILSILCNQHLGMVRPDNRRIFNESHMLVVTRVQTNWPKDSRLPDVLITLESVSCLLVSQPLVRKCNTLVDCPTHSTFGQCNTRPPCFFHQVCYILTTLTCFLNCLTLGQADKELTSVIQYHEILGPSNLRPDGTKTNCIIRIGENSLGVWSNGLLHSRDLKLLSLRHDVTSHASHCRHGPISTTCVSYQPRATLSSPSTAKQLLRNLREQLSSLTKVVSEVVINRSLSQLLTFLNDLHPFDNVPFIVKHLTGTVSSLGIARHEIEILDLHLPNILTNELRILLHVTLSCTECFLSRERASSGRSLSFAPFARLNFARHSSFNEVLTHIRDCFDHATTTLVLDLGMNCLSLSNQEMVLQFLLLESPDPIAKVHNNFVQPKPDSFLKRRQVMAPKHITLREWHVRTPSSKPASFQVQRTQILAPVIKLILGLEGVLVQMLSQFLGPVTISRTQVVRGASRHLTNLARVELDVHVSIVRSQGFPCLSEILSFPLGYHLCSRGIH
ncbi:hypothetical protein D3C78_637570 [compost metagenome]